MHIHKSAVVSTAEMLTPLAEELDSEGLPVFISEFQYYFFSFSLNSLSKIMILEFILLNGKTF